MVSSKTVAVDARELRNAFDLVSAGGEFEVGAWICLQTGKIYWRSPEAGMEDEDFPEDIEDTDRYLAMPNQRDLGLGRRVALAFTAEELPDDHDTVSGFFRRRGAYGRFKDLLLARGLLDSWHEFEGRAAEEALLAWCEERGIHPMAGNP